MSASSGAPTQRHRVVVIGGGFGGLQAARHLATAPVDLTIVDRRNFHRFQPLTYEVATGALSPGEVAYPLRAVFRRHRNVRVVMAEVTGFDLEGRRVQLAEGSLPYDTLIVAGGSHYSYFGHDDWRIYAPEVNRSRARSQHVHAFWPHSRTPRPSRTPTGAGRCSPSSSSAPARPASRWPARSPSPRAARCATSSAPSILASPGSC